MKALNLHEFVSGLMDYLRESGNAERFKELMDEGLEFFNQKFTVDMLVNPVMADGVNIKPLIQQAESLRLFEGWIKHNDNEYECDSVSVELVDDILWFAHIDHTIAVGCAETLNDFITLCGLAGINLSWNNNNERIKKLFGKEGDTK